MSCCYQRTCLLILTLLLCFTQAGCTALSGPPKAVLKDAIQVQMQLTHRSLDEVLDLDEQIVQIGSVNLDSTMIVPNQESRLISVSGSFNCRFPGASNEENLPFNLFLERGEKGQSWRLAMPSALSNGLFIEWNTYPLPIES